MISFEEVNAELKKGSKVLLLVRHAERTKIDNNDPTFGENIPITENGVEMCREFGKRLKEVHEKVEWRASPLRRTVMTAEEIAAGMGINEPKIVKDDLIGNGSAFFEDRYEVFKLFQDHRFFEHMLEYFEHGEQIGFNEIKTAADAYETYAMSRFEGKFGIFTTHDVFVAAFLEGKGAFKFEVESWPRFLDAAAIIVAEDGTRRYELFRAYLSNDICGVNKHQNIEEYYET